MHSMTDMLAAAVDGDRAAAAALLPLVYADLRAAAGAIMAKEASGNTLDPTGLVHEAYLRLVGPVDSAKWASRRHFFTAAADAMRHILIDAARRRLADKRGGGRGRADVDLDQVSAVEADPDRWLALDEALTALAAADPAAAEVAKLRLCVGVSVEEAGDILGLSRATAFRQWAYARAWLAAYADRQA